MLTPQNYFASTKDIDFSSMPKAIQQGHAFIVDLSNNGQTWTDYHESNSIHDTVNMYFKALEKLIIKPKARTAKLPPKSSPTQKSKASQPANKQAVKVTQVERVDEEIKFIRKYLGLHEKEKTKEQILAFINSLQKAILEKRIRKTSACAEQIKYIQDGLIKLYNKMGGSITIKIKDDVLVAMQVITASEKVRLSVAYLKRYISMQGKQITVEKAERLLHVIEAAFDKETIPLADPYAEGLKKVMLSLRAYLKMTDQTDTLHIHEATLNGLQKALDGCGCSQAKLLSGTIALKAANSSNAAAVIMNSMDFAKLKFHKLGFTGEWLKLIGDPSPGFTMMIFGLPKMGKSYLAVHFAAYLARHHGKVLYVAKEEGLDRTLQEKLNSKEIKHPNLDVADNLPEDLSSYDFIFLDSVNRLGLSAAALRKLKTQYPTKSFVYIFQSTKAGSFRGDNNFQHDVDVVIEVPDKGLAVSMGRFNQGGEMEIFPTNNL